MRATINYRSEHPKEVNVAVRRGLGKHFQPTLSAFTKRPFSIDSDEARAFRTKIEPGIKEAGEKGLICDIPSKIPAHSEL